MSGVMASVDQRTQLAGRNRLELLMFRLAGRQLYGINVFKVREVLQCPPLNSIPQSHSVVRGIAHIRGQTITIMDLSMAIGGPAIQNIDEKFIIISEYNRAIQGFLVNEVDRIINLNWKDILPPPPGTAGASYLTAVTHIDKQMVEIIDVERVLAEVIGVKENVQQEILDRVDGSTKDRNLVLISDDSVVARKQVKRALDQMGLESVLCNDGFEALSLLKQWADDGDEQSSIYYDEPDIHIYKCEKINFITQLDKCAEIKKIQNVIRRRYKKAIIAEIALEVFEDRLSYIAFVYKLEIDEEPVEIYLDAITAKIIRTIIPLTSSN
ncbi:MAG: chemotaxis protein [Sulfurovum sp.]